MCNYDPMPAGVCRRPLMINEDGSHAAKRRVLTDQALGCRIGADPELGEDVAVLDPH